eukprot:TRINITY_DN4700_c0_g1_i1.p1 TRINITY_DN4700_c0_g1~~TRINITY_DN4700_c0_g1_i1.p1  ORF type:complete len:427 (+),score=108.91 TRINITY_DN4700_c0_g1_i1:90-1370(+)
MKLFVVTALALAVCGVTADKAFRSNGDLSHVVRVGRNGRQVISNAKGFRQGQPRQGRKVLRRQGERNGRNVHHVHHAPALNLIPVAPAPFALPFASAPAPFALPFASAPAHFAFHHAPAPAPAPVQFTAFARQPTLEYGAPATIAPEVRIAPAYLAPAEEPKDSYLAAAAEPVVESARDSYLVDPEPVVEAARDNYLAAAAEPVVQAARDSYIVDTEPIVESAQNSYLAVPEPVAESAPVVIEAKNTYIAASPSRTQETYVPRTAANVRATAKPKQIAIVRSHNNPPAETAAFDYAFETENGIKQEATGTVRNVDDVDVTVMKGSYEFIGADGVVYAVDWYADETGFHATAPHLPKSVEPNHPEVAAAVRAQIKFAAEEDAARAASSRSSSYAAPTGSYGAPSEQAAVIDARAEEPISQYGLPSYN